MHINNQDFWDFSSKLWDDPQVQQALILAQDQWQVDCCLILLLAYTAENLYTIDNLDHLITVSAEVQEQRLIPLRQQRRYAKGQDTELYDALKTKELDEEAALMRRLALEVSLVPVPVKGHKEYSLTECHTNLSAMIIAYFQAMDIANLKSNAHKISETLITAMTESFGNR